jgi:hypothetical protein
MEFKTKTVRYAPFIILIALIITAFWSHIHSFLVGLARYVGINHKIT